MNKEVIRVIEENIAEMFDEVESNCVETELILTHIEVAIKALEYFKKEQVTDDFMVFCRTGKYPV